MTRKWLVISIIILISTLVVAAIFLSKLARRTHPANSSPPSGPPQASLEKPLPTERALAEMRTMSPEDALNELKRRKIWYHPDEFVRRAERGDTSVVNLFLDTGMDPNIMEKSGITALMKAVLRGNTEMAKVLLERGADPNVKSRIGDITALSLATTTKNNELARMLVASGAEVAVKTKGRPSPLANAVASGNLELLEILLEAGAEIDPEPPTTGYGSGRVVLNEAVLRGHSEAARMLLDHGLKVTTDGSAEERQLIEASLRGDSEGATELLEKGTNPNAAIVKGLTPLMAASGLGYTEIARVLLAKGANPDIKDNIGNAPLVAATINGHKDIVELLFSKGANPDAEDRDGRTALGHAIVEGRPEIVEVLLQKGANPNVVDEWNFTPLELARHDGEITCLLIKAGADDSKVHRTRKGHGPRVYRDGES